LRVHLQHGIHGVSQAFERLAVVRISAIAATVAGIDVFLGVEEKDHECKIIVEFKQIQIGIVDARQTHANEFVGHIFNLLETDNLPVKFAAVRSRDATDHYHNGLAALFRLRLALGEAGQPAVLAGIGNALAPVAELRWERRANEQDNELRKESGGYGSHFKSLAHRLLKRKDTLTILSQRASQ